MLTILEYVLLTAFVAVLIVVSRWLGHQAYSWLPPQATAEAQRVDDLFSFLVAVGAFIFLALIGTIVYSVIFFRAKPDDYSEGHPMRGNAKIEIAWMVVPTILVLWIAFQNINIYNQLNILGLKQIAHLPIEAPVYAAASDDMPKPAAEQITVMAKQWAWSFRYPNNVTSPELHLPVNQSTRLDLQAQDVIHGFYVPEFRLKQDIIPNRDVDLVITPNRIGKYRLKDSQFSGSDFALMGADVYVESRQAYDQWLIAAAQHPTIAADSTSTPSPAKPPLINTGWYTGLPPRSPVAEHSSPKAEHS
jgi:cytochrome c oxidase subunit 2